MINYSQLISRSSDHHFVPSFGMNWGLLAMSEEISSYRCLKGVMKALQVYKQLAN